MRSLDKINSLIERARIIPAVGLLLTSLMCSVVSAQTTAQISGTAKDPSGALLPGVEIKATQTETGLSRTTVTNETGTYVLASLPIGPYRLEATLPGFRTYVQTGIILQVDANAVPRGTAGIQSRDKRPSRPVWTPLRRLGQRGDQGGHQRLSRNCF